MTDSEPFPLRRIAVAVYGPSVLFGVAEGAILPVVALSVRELGGSVALAALVVTLIGIGSLLSNIPASYIASRWGERKALVGASLLGAAAMAVCGLGHSILTFSAGAFMVGMAGAVFSLARQSYIAVVVPFRYRARALSTLGGVMRIGLFIGPFGGAAVIPWLGIAGAYATGVAAMLAGAWLAWRTAELPPVEAAQPVAASPSPGASAVRPPGSLRAVGANYLRVFATVGVGVVLVSAVRASRQAVLPLWAEQIGLDAATTSLIYGCASGIDMLAFYPAGKVMDVRGRVWVAVPSMLLMGVAFALMPFTHAMATLLGASLLLGLGNGIGSGMVMTLGADYSPAIGRAHFLGLWRLMSDIGSTGGPALLSAVTALLSLAAGIWMTAALAILAAALLAWWVPRTKLP